MKSSLITTIFLAVTFNLVAQNSVVPDSSFEFKTTYPSPIQTAECSGFINPPSIDLQWLPILTNIPFETEDESIDKELVDSIKAENLKQRQWANPLGNDSLNKESSAESLLPVVGVNFAGNLNNGMTPLDNSIAISNGGIIVSVANYTIGYYNSSGQMLYANSLLTMVKQVNPNITGVCDPVVLYDSGSDRFIWFVQSIYPLAGNKIFIFFSKTNNPTDGWWGYNIVGDPTGSGDGFDYPKLGVSTNELFVTGNLYDVNEVYHRSVIFQINKTAGYSGASTINYRYYYNITNSPTTLLPVSYGQSGSYTKTFFVSTLYNGGSVIELYQITGDIASSPVLNNWTVSTTPYSVAPKADQMGTNVLLENGDCRAMSGFYLYNAGNAIGTIHFVFHSNVNGFANINYNRLVVNNLSNTSKTFGLNGYSYCYPSVVSYATTSSDNSVMIGFGSSGSADYPDIRVVNVDNAMNWSSSVRVKSSVSYIDNYTINGKTRWGDYTGTSRRHNSPMPSIWMNGMFGNSSHRFDTWIAEIHDPTTILIPVPSFSASKTNLCPNDCINFLDNSTNNPTSWNWTFTGGTPSTSTAKNPTNICYPNKGNYDVKLTATNSAGSDTRLYSAYITVNQCELVPKPSFSASKTNLCPNDCINFYDNSLNNPIGWNWKFTGGSPSTANVRNPTNICYSNAGTYDVKLISSNAAGSDSVIYSKYITVNPCVGIETNTINPSKTIVSPNPVIETFMVKFMLSKTSNIEISILDVNGKIVKGLYRGEVTKGENAFSFNRANLSTGTYFLMIKSNTEIIKNEKIIITN